MNTPAAIGSVVMLTTLSASVLAADIEKTPTAVKTVSHHDKPGPIAGKIVGRAAAIDGRTLWFPQAGLKVQLAGLDACMLPQWSFDPRQHGDNRFLKPVPCGALAKAWLKRTLKTATVSCTVLSAAAEALIGRCKIKGDDLGLEMLSVGWARVRGATSVPPAYIAAQQRAVAARYGMWASYVLDMDEWRGKAVDQTLARTPTADLNLLAEREHEIAPPFWDARTRPARRDR